jgi:GH15 family glucan-1,4-alpha-glucosidase
VAWRPDGLRGTADFQLVARRRITRYGGRASPTAGTAWRWTTRTEEAGSGDRHAHGIFLPGDDERVSETIDAIWRELGRDGFVSRSSTAITDDGLPGDEGQCLACWFWLVNALARTAGAKVEQAAV